jgi:predicted nucleotidyltransferase
VWLLAVETETAFGWRQVEKNMCMLDEIRAKRDEIYAVAKRHKAERLWVFGSCARREEPA